MQINAAVSLKERWIYTQVYNMSACCIIGVNEDKSTHSHRHVQTADLLHSYHFRLNNHQLFSSTDVGLIMA